MGSFMLLTCYTCLVEDATDDQSALPGAAWQFFFFPLKWRHAVGTRERLKVIRDQYGAVVLTVG